jgi:hypothetical protein
LRSLSWLRLYMRKGGSELRKREGPVKPAPFELLSDFAQASKNPIFTPASWITSLSTSLRAWLPMAEPFTSG